jgi:hypothetical protein
VLDYFFLLTLKPAMEQQAFILKQGWVSVSFAPERGLRRDAAATLPAKRTRDMPQARMSLMTLAGLTPVSF